MHLVALDDCEPIAQFMATVARDRGWTAQTVTDEATFQALVSAAPPDAIMLDLQLGTSDGVEQLHFLRDAGYGGAIVLISGFDSRVLASVQQVGTSLGLTVAAMLEKPVPAARIHEVLATIEQQPAAAPLAAAAARSQQPSISADDVAQAIAADRMELHLQPIVSASGHVVTCAEALIRWRDPVFGLVPPERFIPVAEADTGVIDQLTMWAAKTGAAQYRQLAEAGSATRICINVSGQNLRSQDFPDRMTDVLQRLSLPQGAIGLEVTEGVAMHDLDATTAILSRLRLKGFPVAIDDFGIGHSSFEVLRRMPFSTIKIDKSFVSGLATSGDSLPIVRSVIQLAHEMRLSSVAEGVEDLETARLLTDLGIDGLQGFYFSRPLPFDAFATWLHVWSRHHTPIPSPSLGDAEG